jgi:hypothetical protein
MGISVIGAGSSSGSGGGTNNFVLKTTAETTYVLDRTYTSGRYSLSFLDSDTAFDIYAIAEDGTYAGYTASTTLEVSADFAEVVVLGAASGTRISFTHLGVLTEAVTSGDVATAGAFISSVVTSSLPSVDDTTVVNGGNFAADVEVIFIDQSAVETAAKTVVRSSSTQLLITRPDAFLPSDSPFTVKVVNPGIPVPSGANAHLLSNSVTAGTNPVWTTDTAVPYSIGGATNYTFLATDTEATDIDYSVVSGTLPAGLALDGETGVLSGTASGTPSEGNVTAITIRAIDTGGNFLDKAFNLTANVAPVWTTTAGAISTKPTPSNVYSFQLVASTGAAGGALTYTLQSGALLPGHSLSSTGLISGTSTGVLDDTATFTVRVTDEGGLFADRQFSIQIVAPVYALTATYNSTATHTFAASTTLFAAFFVGGGAAGQAGTVNDNNASGAGGVGGSSSWSGAFYDVAVTGGSQMLMTNGGPGGSTSVGNLANASYLGSNAGGANGVNVSGNAGGNGGAGQTGTFSYGNAGNGGNAVSAISLGSIAGLPNSITNGGSGGGGGSGAHFEYNGQGVNRSGGPGGAAYGGGGQGGYGGTVSNETAVAAQSGYAGNVAGAGGGGGGGRAQVSGTNGNAGAGGAGTAGQILIYEK